MSNFDDVYSKMANSPESKVKNRIWMYNNNFCICDANYRDLMKFSNKVNESYRIIRSMPNAMNEIQLINLDLLRRIFNYLSSAFTLVAYSRTFMRRYYAGTEVQKIYEMKVKEYFQGDNLHRFVQDLRNYFLHEGINSFGYGIKAEDTEKDNVHFYTILQKKDLEKSDYLNADSKKYLEILPNQIDIMNELTKYHDRVQRFYKWLFDFLQDNHKEEISRANEYQKEYFEELYRMWNEK